MLRSICLVLGLMLYSGTGVAEEVTSIEAKGNLIFMGTQGQLTAAEVSLVVPARGEGEVVLKAHGSELTSNHFRSWSRAGRTTFAIVFDAGESTITLIGTYMRGNNAAVYYGDVFVHAGSADSAEDRLAELESNELDAYTHVGAFNFIAAAP